MKLATPIVSFISSTLKKLWYFQYRFKKNYEVTHLPEMDSKPLEGYTNKAFYFDDETIHFYLKSSCAFSLTIEKITAPYTYEAVYIKDFDKIIQSESSLPSENGLRWNCSFSIAAEQLTQGYYRAFLSSCCGDEFFITFIVGHKSEKAQVIIIAPTTTWIAYNPYGGKSAYKNIADQKNVHSLSTQRPNTALQYKENGGSIHDVNIEANIYNWFCQHYQCSLIPDTLLESGNSIPESTDIFVLSYHCEYFSSKMYSKLRELITDTNKSLLNLGANQVYWKVQYTDDYNKLEIRKDHTLFSKTKEEGAMWRQTSFPEHDLFGVHFTDVGTGTYAPYKVLLADHWLFDGSNISDGELFGLRGINSLPICGDETDKTPKANTVEIIARGLNCNNIGNLITYPDQTYTWDGTGGGDIALKIISDKNAVLSTGSIQSGSGLGTDPVFTTIVKNFVNRYLRKHDK